MSAEEFWHGEPRLAVSYREAENMKRENRHVAEWRQGVYFRLAILSALEKDVEYPKEPLFSEAVETELEVERKEEAQMRLMQERIEARVAKINEKFRSEKGDGDKQGQ